MPRARKSVGTYAVLLRSAMRKHGLTVTDLSRRVGFSYEHIRKVLAGMPVQSETFNAAVCQVLLLNVDEMLALSRREKAERRAGRLGIQPEQDMSMVRLWPMLSADDQERVLSYTRALSDRRLAAIVDSGLAEPPQIARRIQQLVAQLGRAGA